MYYALPRNMHIHPLNSLTQHGTCFISANRACPCLWLALLGIWTHKPSMTSPQRQQKRQKKQRPPDSHPYPDLSSGSCTTTVTHGQYNALVTPINPKAVENILQHLLHRPAHLPPYSPRHHPRRPHRPSAPRPCREADGKYRCDWRVLRADARASDYDLYQ